MCNHDAFINLGLALCQSYFPFFAILLIYLWSNGKIDLTPFFVADFTLSTVHEAGCTTRVHARVRVSGMV